MTTIDESKTMLIAKAKCIDNQCKGIYEDCNKSLCDSCDLCYIQGTNGEQIKLLLQCANWLEELKRLREHNEKYKWHDLRKNPEDLPDDSRKVECRTVTAKGLVNAVFGYYSDRWCCGMNSNVIKWREIEPLEED